MAMSGVLARFPLLLPVCDEDEGESNVRQDEVG